MYPYEKEYSIANGVAAITSLGCISADITVVGGIVCHAAVFTVLAMTLDNNQIAYEDCVEHCKE